MDPALSPIVKWLCNAQVPFVGLSSVLAVSPPKEASADGPHAKRRRWFPGESSLKHGRIALLPLLILALGLAIGSESSGAVPARALGLVTEVAGTVIVIPMISPPHALKVGDPVYLGDTVEVPQDGRVRLVLSDNTTLTLRELSCLYFRNEERVVGAHYSIKLLLGKARSAAGRALRPQAERRDGGRQSAVASVRG